MNQFFYIAATFCSVFFIWQFLAALIGLTGDHDADVSGDIDSDADFEEIVDSADSFKLISLRSIITFFTLFTWGSALYLNDGLAPARAMFYSILWGLAGMLCVAAVFYWMRKLNESGNRDLKACAGSTGTVYLDIPANGTGEVRVTVSGAVSYVKARSQDDRELPAGTPIVVLRCIDQNMLEVKPVTDNRK